MKLLLFCSDNNASRKIRESLNSQGAMVLVAESISDAKSLLRSHKSTLDLIYIHRESDPLPNGGDEFLKLIKTESKYAEARDIPVLFSSKEWTESDFAKHQREVWGANAYLRFPFEIKNFIKRVEDIFGGSLSETTRVAMQALQPIDKSPQTKVDIKKAASRPFSVQDQNTENGYASKATVAEVSLSLQREDSGQHESSGLQGTGIQEGLSLTGAADDRALHGNGQNSSELSKMEVHTSVNSGPNAFQKPVGDPIVPGGASSSPDVETLKHYLTLREQDVAVLSNQLKLARDRILQLENEKVDFQRRWEDLNSLSAQYREQLEQYQQDHETWEKMKQQELSEREFQIQVKSEKVRSVENRLKSANQDVERIKERMRVEVRRVRSKEQELENRLELTRKDFESMVKARENKIVELKRKLDSMEFNYEILQDQFLRERHSTEDLREKLGKALQATRAAVGTLEQELTSDTPTPESKRAG